MKTSNHVEIMSPVGSYAALTSAIRSGAGSIYFGVGKLNMRSRAASPFDTNDIKKIARICRWCHVRSYLALNTLVYDNELQQMRIYCDLAKAAGISAVIATDLSTIQYAHRIGLEVHMSVQANISNMDAVRFFAQFADTIVLARELSLEQISFICSTVKEENLCGPSGRLLQIEIFVHGALCVAISGKCYMSLGVYNHSANRGDCLQNCRRRYRIIDDETNDELLIENQFVMSPKDLCTIAHLDKILATGVSILKIEGRGRTPDYVSTVTRVYHEALTAIKKNTFTPDRHNKWKDQLAQVYNRGFWDGGYYCGNKMGEWSAAGHSQASLRRVQVGRVSNYFSKIGVVEFQLKSASLTIGDEVLIEGNTTGALRIPIIEIRVDGKLATEAHKGDVVIIASPRRVRRNDKVFVHDFVLSNTK